jgi:hypothetical protein
MSYNNTNKGNFKPRSFTSSNKGTGTDGPTPVKKELTGTPLGIFTSVVAEAAGSNSKVADAIISIGGKEYRTGLFANMGEKAGVHLGASTTDQNSGEVLKIRVFAARV